MKYRILVGTHHKSGTAWMNGIFDRLSQQLKIKFIKNGLDGKPDSDYWDIFFHNHSQFDFSYLGNFTCKGLHIIRDPRDLIVSGAFYHCKSQEDWLHKKQLQFSGLTYQEKINSYTDIDDKILFEMENAAKKTMKEIEQWNYKTSNFYEAKYENLIVDNELIEFKKIFEFLEFTEKEVLQALKITHNNSLFSGKVQKSIHVRSGKSQQWKTYFKQLHKKRFIEIYGNLLIKLGYETNNDWANS